MYVSIALRYNPSFLYIRLYKVRVKVLLLLQEAVCNQCRLQNVSASHEQPTYGKGWIYCALSLSLSPLEPGVHLVFCFTTLDHVLVLSLGSTYMPFDLD